MHWNVPSPSMISGDFLKIDIIVLSDKLLHQPLEKAAYGVARELAIYYLSHVTLPAGMDSDHHNKRAYDELEEAADELVAAWGFARPVTATKP
jgi:hypothetical protein